jgi:hypothetical protein
MRAPTISFIALFTTLCAGCIEPDLGDVPFFCNTGDPKCPDGYECVAGRCVLEGLGATTDSAGGASDQGPAVASDGQLPQPDSSTPPVKWDLGAAPPDASAPKLDTGTPPPSSCATNSDCTDPLYPCCCIGTCELVCLFTLCF